MEEYINQEKTNKNMFLLNYKSILIKYLAYGNPSKDTLHNYYSIIDQYIDWCFQHKLNPLDITEYQFIYYRDFLIESKLKSNTIKTKINSIKRFYDIAVNLKIINLNPIKNIGIKVSKDNELSLLDCLTDEQLKHLLQIIPEYDDQHIEYLRDRVIIMFMALEGLCTIEIHNMSVSDISWKEKIICVHGKGGRSSLIFPRSDTFSLLQQYIQKRDCNIIDERGEPVFTSISNYSKGQRMDRRGIRYNIDKWLFKSGLKRKGKSCHMLHDTCGALVYKNTKDLTIVKNVLRNTDINTSSKYANVYDKTNCRYSSKIKI